MKKESNEKYFALADALRNLGIAIDYFRADNKYKQSEELEKARKIIMEIFDE